MTHRINLAPRTLFMTAFWSGGLQMAQTATVIGYPANFAAVNNAGGETHGFEIEADGIQSTDLTPIFGGNFVKSGGPCLIRYCVGTAVDFPGGRSCCASPGSSGGSGKGGTETTFGSL